MAAPAAASLARALLEHGELRAAEAAGAPPTVAIPTAAAVRAIAGTVARELQAPRRPSLLASESREIRRRRTRKDRMRR
eukprot:6789909-Pyramimonas_sp.AAC.1